MTTSRASTLTTRARKKNTGARVSSPYARTHVRTPRRFLSKPSAAFHAYLFLLLLLLFVGNENDHITCVYTCQKKKTQIENTRVRIGCDIGSVCFMVWVAFMDSRLSLLFFLIFRKAKLVGDEKHRKVTKRKKRSALRGTGTRLLWLD